ncbi:MAG TPA: hypothetical protein VN151_05740 [Terracidiphilus sp.]|nr:hypothetical protein [Terracidiphilus sp.]
MFIFVREPGALERFGFPLFATIVLWNLWKSRTFFVQCFVVFAIVYIAVSCAASWLHGKQAILRISNNELIASGNLARIFTTEVRFPVGEIRTLKWDSGGEDGTPGLYAKREWASTLLLPYIDEAQASMIRDAVARRFPEIKIDDDYAASILYGNESGITTLGLNPSTDESSEMKS